jgi:hypothetical protein
MRASTSFSTEGRFIVGCFVTQRYTKVLQILFRSEGQVVGRVKRNSRGPACPVGGPACRRQGALPTAERKPAMMYASMILVPC